MSRVSQPPVTSTHSTNPPDSVYACTGQEICVQTHRYNNDVDGGVARRSDGKSSLDPREKQNLSRGPRSRRKEDSRPIHCPFQHFFVPFLAFKQRTTNSNNFPSFNESA